MPNMNKDNLQVGDKVLSTRNNVDRSLRYIIEEVYKTCCTVRIAPECGWEIMKGGEIVNCRPAYKGTKYNILKKV